MNTSQAGDLYVVFHFLFDYDGGRTYLVLLYINSLGGGGTTVVVLPEIFVHIELSEK